MFLATVVVWQMATHVAGRSSVAAAERQTAPNANGAVNPLLFPGADLGDQINNVFAAGDHCAEVGIPPGKYVYATTIHLFQPCQSVHGAGAALTTLEYTGNGDAIQWQMLPYTIKKAGTLKGFTLKGPGTAVGNGIRSGSLIGATFEDLMINNFRGPNSAAILLENIKTTADPKVGNNFQAWTERTVMRDVHIGFPHIGNTTAIAFASHGGTNSFGYTDIADVWLNVEDGQVGVNWDSGTYTYNSKLNFHANISGSGSNAFVIGGVIRNSLLYLNGEAHCAKDLIHVVGAGEVQAQGLIAVNCASKLTTQGRYARTDLAGVRVDNPHWDAFQLSPFYAPLINGKGVLITNSLENAGETDLTNYYGASSDASSSGGFNLYNTYAGVEAPNSDPRALLAKLTAGGNWIVSGSASWGGGTPVASSDQLALKSQLPLSGRTAGIGATLKAGNCASGIANVAGAHPGQVVPHPNASDGSLDSPMEIVSGAVTAANIVTVQRCAIAPVTLSPETYTVRVLP
jgi:hypothetical protein